MARKRKLSLVLLVAAALLVLIGLSRCVHHLTTSAPVTNAPPPSPPRPQPATAASPVTVKFGFYPLGLYDLDSTKGSFMADFYIWLKYDKTIDPEYLQAEDAEESIPN